MLELEDLLQEMVDRRSSDLFLKAGSRPSMRVDGAVLTTEYEYLSVEDMEELSIRGPFGHMIAARGSIGLFAARRKVWRLIESINPSIHSQ